MELGYARNGRRKPSVPIEKLSTGGTAAVLNNEDACRIVPSPPRVTTRSMGCTFAPGMPNKHINLYKGKTTDLAKLPLHEVYQACLHEILVRQDTSCAHA